jgi:hypothetical protein
MGLHKTWRHIFNVEVQYKLSDLVVTCSNLPSQGYVQSSEKLETCILQRWFNAEWSPFEAIAVVP